MVLYSFQKTLELNHPLPPFYRKFYNSNDWICHLHVYIAKWQYIFVYRPTCERTQYTQRCNFHPSNMFWRSYCQQQRVWQTNLHKTCGNKMPTRCNRGFYCRSYCLLNMFRAPLCPSARAQKYYTVVAACGISCCGFQVVGLVLSWGFSFSSILQTGHITLSCTPETTWKPQHQYHRKQPLL